MNSCCFQLPVHAHEAKAGHSGLRQEVRGESDVRGLSSAADDVVERTEL